MTEFNTDKTLQWWTTYHAHAEWMRYEAADIGYDFTNAAAAQKDYIARAIAYKKAWGREFDAFKRPKNVQPFQEQAA